MVLRLAGEEPVECHAHGECYMQDDVEDVVFCYLRFPSGLAAHLHLSWLDPHKERRFTVVGSKKMATFDDMALEQKLKVYDKGFDQPYEGYGEYIARSGDVHSPQISNEEPLRIECRHFVECLRDGAHAALGRRGRRARGASARGAAAEPGRGLARRRVPRLLATELATTGSLMAVRRPNPSSLTGPENSTPLASACRRRDVVAHEIELLAEVSFARMRGELRRRQREDEPAAAGVDGRELEDVAQEGAKGFRLLGEDDGVDSVDHRTASAGVEGSIPARD